MARDTRNTKHNGRTSKRVDKFVKKRKLAGKERKWERQARIHANNADQFLFEPKGKK